MRSQNESGPQAPLPKILLSPDPHEGQEWAPSLLSSSHPSPTLLSAWWAGPALTSEDLVGVGGAEVQGQDPGNASTVQPLCRSSHIKPSHG